MPFILAFGTFSLAKNDLLNLTNAGSSLHRWAQNKTLSFIPPDGKFILADYRYAPNASNLSSTPTAVASNARANVALPFAMKAGYEIEDNSGALYLCI